MMSNINKKERLERRSSISLSFKFDLQLFADTITPSGDPNLPDHKKADKFLDDNTIPLSDDKSRRSNPYIISHIDKRFKSWATYMMDVRLENLDDWFAKQGIIVRSGIQDWPGDGPRNDRWLFQPRYFQDPSGRTRELSAEDQNRVMHYFDSIVYVSSAEHFTDMLNIGYNKGSRSNESFISLATIERLVKHMNFMSCTSMQGMFFGTGGGMNHALPPVINQTITFENFTFSTATRPNMDHMFEQSAFKGLVIKSNLVPGSMDYFLKDCKFLETVDLTSIAEKMIVLPKLRETFAGCSRLKEVKGIIYLDGLVWNAIDNNGTKFDTFKGCTSLQKPVTFAGFNLSTFCRGNDALFNYYMNKYGNSVGVLERDSGIVSEILNIPKDKVAWQ